MSSNQKASQSYTRLTPNEYRSYAQKRQEVYGQDGDAQKHPSVAAERDYYTYSELKEQSKASMGHYKTTYKRISGQTYEGFDNPKSKFDLLEQDQHRELVSPAAEVATDTNLHASARHAFLDTHPFAYRTMKKRVNHEKLADEATEDAKHYRQVYDTHYERAGAPPRRESPPYGSHGSPVPPPQRPGNPRIPAQREAYGQASYSAQGSATAATSSAYRQPRSDPRIPSPSEAYGQSSYSTRNSARVPVPTSYDQLPKGSPPPPRPLFDSSIPTPAEAYPHVYGRRQHSRE
ncbi:hypothetical protein DER45DRAFT_580217 [Fusarium avenaceum]|nr:hypothetical protein DER45DRAFT_580217 [Fusarium avenaceum]